MSYCTPLDLIAHANRARLIGQLAGSDYAALPDDNAVMAYFIRGDSTPDTIEALSNLESRLQQAISNAAGDINGYLALVPAVRLPADTLKAACMDMALYRLFESLPDESVIKQLNDARHAFFDKLVTGKIPVNSGTVSTGAAAVQGEEIFFTPKQLQGY